MRAGKDAKHALSSHAGSGTAQQRTKEETKNKTSKIVTAALLGLEKTIHKECNTPHVAAGGRLSYFSFVTSLLSIIIEMSEIVENKVNFGQLSN